MVDISYQYCNELSQWRDDEFLAGSTDNNGSRTGSHAELCSCPWCVPIYNWRRWLIFLIPLYISVHFL